MNVVRRLLLLSNSTQHGEGYLDWCSDQVKNFFSRYNVNCILFVPYAFKDHDRYAKKVKTKFQELGFEMESIHEKENPVEAVNIAQGIFIGGGNTFLLLKTLYENDLIEAIQNRVLKDGIPYMGASAGTNVATCSICTTNDMPIVYPPSFNALCLVPFNINPHFIDADPNSKYAGETRETRIKEYHAIPETPAVLGLREGCYLLVCEERTEINGLSGARLFVSGKDPVEYSAGSDMSFLFK
ncbi:alpha-aspartyl dipeptidase [Centruroides vittatus]|uniref:alpha-aspartyl dipeptidase n=1 Tax=Centruroides vittatus TaxID=120091 RepID=UPI00350F08D6